MLRGNGCMKHDIHTTFNENVIYQGAIIRCGMDAVYSLARGRFWYLSGRELFKMKDAACDVKIV